MSEAAKEAIPGDVLAKVEAALYASGRPLSLDEISRVAGTASERKATAIAREVARAVNGSLQAVEVVEYAGPKFAMQLKAQYTQTARKFATRPLLTRAALRTLSFIAFFQPISAAELVLRRSSTVYQHLRELEEVGFVVGERQGRSKNYRTTPRFAEYFGLSNDTTTMKRQLESRTLTLR
ncbi:MAG TPA: SMC-Scp complex subunit ScpB [Nitrososphaerales archaeon]|nr:SMC-Scp complex subunit ScpB [Nitrososphaerales archaeon]